MKPHLAFAALLITSTANVEAQDTSTTNVPDHVRSMIVRITSFGDTREEDGAGIVVGFDSSAIYIITAKHVVEEEIGKAFPQIVVGFAATSDTAIAVVERMSDDDLDLAVIRIDREIGLNAGLQPGLDRLGSSRSLVQGDHVSPVGCPEGVCWQAPMPADQIISANTLAISFQSTFVKGGSSGGGIFNRWWEVVGVVTDERPPRAEALPMDFVIRRLSDWNIPVALSAARIPRGGYTATIGLTWLFPTTSGGFHGRLPSGRISLRLTTRSAIEVTVSGLRLAPKKVGVSCPGSPGDTASVAVQVSFRERPLCEAVANYVMGGFALPVRFGPITARPFVELGMGRTRARYDVGGFYEQATLEYIPNMRAVEQTAFGVGGGMSIEYAVLPKVIFEGSLGFWSLNDPFEGADLPVEYKPEMPKVHFGIGLRWGLRS